MSDLIWSDLIWSDLAWGLAFLFCLCYVATFGARTKTVVADSTSFGFLLNSSPERLVVNGKLLGAVNCVWQKDLDRNTWSAGKAHCNRIVCMVVFSFLWLHSLESPCSLKSLSMCMEVSCKLWSVKWLESSRTSLLTSIGSRRRRWWEWGRRRRRRRRRRW
jgi:hypothetical protein